MKIILDTNVFVSGVFFKGPPREILRAWNHGKVQLVLSAEILAEYQRVGADLAVHHRGVDLAETMQLLELNSTIRDSPPLPSPVSRDPDDDKFLACALAASVRRIVSGDKHLLDVSGFAGIEILTPRQFVSRYLRVE